MIYKDDGFTISSHGMWLPGIYESERAARYAFRFDDGELQTLSDRVCRADGENRQITFADLKSLRQAR